MANQDREQEQFVDQMMYLLTAPGITMPGHEDLYRLRQTDAMLQRLAHYREIFDTKQCTEFEAMLYISTASLVHPISRDWGDIYFYLFQRWNPAQAELIKIEPRELDYPQEEDLRRLRSWIYRTQINHLRRRNGLGNPKRLKKEEQDLKEEQQKLF
jgi:hypothetical protein